MLYRRSQEHHIPAWAAYWKGKNNGTTNKPLDVKKAFTHTITSEMCGRMCHGKIRGGANYESHPSYKMAEEAWALWWNTNNGTIHIYDATEYLDGEMKRRFPKAAVFGQRTRGWTTSGTQFCQESGYLSETYPHLTTMFSEVFKPFTSSMMDLIVAGAAVGVHNKRWLGKGGSRTMLDPEQTSSGWKSMAFTKIPVDPSSKKTWTLSTGKASRTAQALIGQPGLPLGAFDKTNWLGDFLRSFYNATSVGSRKGMLYAPTLLAYEEVFKRGRRA